MKRFPDSMSGESRWTHAAVMLGMFAAGLAAALTFAGPMAEFCLDDAYIHLAYAKSLRLGDGYSYNPGDWSSVRLVRSGRSAWRCSHRSRSRP